MKCLLASNGSDHDGRIPFGAEDLGRHIDTADIHQAARPKLIVREAFAISFESCVAVDSGCHVSEVRGRESLSRGGFELKDIQGLGGILDYFVGRLQERISERKQTREQRAAREELQ